MSEADEEDLEISSNQKIGVLASGIVLGIILTIAVDGGLGMFTVYFILSLAFAAFVGTKQGRKVAVEAVNDFNEEMQEYDEQLNQQQQKSSSQPKQICSECGWKNPKSNNYCHDCGTELDG